MPDILVTIQLGLGSESIAHMDVGKEHELGVEALRRKKVHFPPILMQSTPTPGENSPKSRYS
ncbi:MAG: hypothetical protein ABW185_18295 [Sedimenticola sp.]